MSQQRLSDNQIQPAKRVPSYPLVCISLRHPEPDQENELPLDVDLDRSVSFNQIPRTQVCHPPPVDVRYVNPALYNYASLQYELYGNGPRPKLEPGAGPMQRPVVHNRKFEELVLRKSSLLTPEFVHGKSLFGPSLHIKADFSSRTSAIVDSYAQYEPGPAIYEDGSSPMSDATTAVGPMTPSALNFGDLTLDSQGYSLPSSPIRSNGQNNRATVRIVPTSLFARYALQAPIAFQSLTRPQSLPRYQS
jgi:hypothetical protein